MISFPSFFTGNFQHLDVNGCWWKHCPEPVIKMSVCKILWDTHNAHSTHKYTHTPHNNIWLVMTNRAICYDSKFVCTYLTSKTWTASCGKCFTFCFEYTILYPKHSNRTYGDLILACTSHDCFEIIVEW